MNTSFLKMMSSIAICISSICVVSSSVAAQTDPVEMLYNFQAIGQFDGLTTNSTGNPTYTISAVGQAPVVQQNGIIRARNKKDDDDGAYQVVLSGASISFDANEFYNHFPIVRFNCKGCTLTYPDGSVLTSDADVPLEGRAVFGYGPVAPNPATPTIMTVRMAGCSGLSEKAGIGKLAGKIGTICFNGVFNFDMSNPAALPATITGSSNCTIVTHSPVPGFPKFH